MIMYKIDIDTGVDKDKLQMLYVSFLQKSFIFINCLMI